MALGDLGFCWEEKVLSTGLSRNVSLVFMRYHWQVVKSDWLAALAWLFLLAVELFDQHVYKLFMREKKKLKQVKSDSWSCKSQLTYNKGLIGGSQVKYNWSSTINHQTGDKKSFIHWQMRKEKPILSDHARLFRLIIRRKKMIDQLTFSTELFMTTKFTNRWQLSHSNHVSIKTSFVDMSILTNQLCFIP